jgi:4-hydroxyacetophenone monooxygenase
VDNEPQVAKKHSLRELTDLAASANIPTLLMVVYQVTGDSRWLEHPYTPSRSKGLSDNDTGGLPTDVQDEIRAAAAQAFLDLEQGRSPAIEIPSAEQMKQMLGACVGESVDGSYGVMFSEEYGERITGGTAIESDPIGTPPGYRVLIIGAGVSGIIAAHKLTQLCIPFEVVEKHDHAGGNWIDNTYPGAGVDTPSHLYSFSFAPRDWAHHFELRAELEHYFADTYERLGAAPHTRFGTEVVSAEWQPDAFRWLVGFRGPDGAYSESSYDAVISAVGVLNRPKLPRLPGIGTFRGVSFHSSAWPQDFDVTGKRVAIVGSGASAMQIVPAIVDRVASLDVFQRTPPWIAPFEKFQQPIDSGSRYLLRTFPMYRTWYWLKLYWQFGDKVLDSLRKDPEWPFPARSVNSRNDGHREFFTEYIRSELGDRQDLFDKVLPLYPPYGKRILLDNGWYQALCRPHVHLINDAVEQVTAEGIVTTAGVTCQPDVIVWATGFEASRFVSSLEIRGASGLSLRQAWDDDDARAYLGVTVPDFPNLFLLGGPNSFPGSGSFMYFMELQMNYIAGLLRDMLAKSVQAIDVRPDVFTAYNDLVDETAETTVWTHPGTNTFFRNDRGRLVFVSPFRNVEYWTRARRSGLEDYELARTTEASPR